MVIKSNKIFGEGLKYHNNKYLMGGERGNDGSRALDRRNEGYQEKNGKDFFFVFGSIIVSKQVKTKKVFYCLFEFILA